MTEEIFPIEFKAHVFGVCNFVGRLGLLSAPVLAEVFEEPSTILIFTSLIGMVTCVLLKTSDKESKEQSIEMQVKEISFSENFDE